MGTGLEKMAEVSPYGARLRCRVCTIFIGGGHAEVVPVPSPDGCGVVCSSCDAALQRGVILTNALGRASVERVTLKPEDRPGPPGAERP